MQSKDLETLASLLDKNANFTRPASQTTGYSHEAPPPPPAAGQEAAGTASVATAQNPAALPLPPTVVDHQLRLPEPSVGKAAEQRRQAQKRAMEKPIPAGNDIWTQEELAHMYRAQQRGLSELTRGVAGAGAQPSPVMPGASVSAAAAPGGGASTFEPSPDAVEPKHDVLYKQRITAEDVYLQVDPTRDTSSASSEGVVVRVEMPLVASVAEIYVATRPYELTVGSPAYYLRAPLPRRVKEGVADVKWNADQKMLVVNLVADQDGDA